MKQSRGIVLKTREWLGQDGIEFFRQIRDDHDGELNVVLPGHPPHPVHFREGMTVRNFLRGITDYSWTAVEYDDRWIPIVLEAIREEGVRDEL